VGSGRPRGRLNGVDVKSEVLRHARKRAGLSLAQVAGGELTRQAVHLIETGKVRPSMHSLRVIASRLAVPIDSVLLHAEIAAKSEGAVAELGRLVETHHYDRALERGGEILRYAATPPVVALISYHLGHALCKLGRPMEALERLKVARDLFESLGDQDLVAEAMELQALALHIAEQPQALSVAEEALKSYRLADQRRPETEARILERIGTILAARGDFSTARARYDEALQVAGGVRELARVARIYHGLGFCFYGLGDIERAIDMMLKAETLYEAEQRINETPPNLDLPRVENDLGVLLMQAGDLSRAERRIQSALRRLAEMGVERVRSHFLLSLADVRYCQARYSEGVEVGEEAVELALRFHETRALATGYKQLGELHAALGEPDLAVAKLEQALAILEEAGFEERRAEFLKAYEKITAQRLGGGLPQTAAG
jgi:tetratricopeptide (TPR) repeat protein